jgi:hypothetical protein
MEDFGTLSKCVCLEEEGTRLLYHWRAFHRYTRLSTLQGVSWLIIILGGGRSEETD